MNRKPVLGPQRRTLTKHRRLGPQKRQPTPVSITMFENPRTMVLNRRYPKRTWVVPAITVPLYWFDIMMLRKKLITPVTDDLFVCGGRRFRVLMQDYKVIGVGYTRWLVYEEQPDLPNGGRP